MQPLNPRYLLPGSPPRKTFASWGRPGCLSSSSSLMRSSSTCKLMMPTPKLRTTACCSPSLTMYGLVQLISPPRPVVILSTSCPWIIDRDMDSSFQSNLRRMRPSEKVENSILTWHCVWSHSSQCRIKATVSSTNGPIRTRTGSSHRFLKITAAQRGLNFKGFYYCSNDD